MSFCVCCHVSERTVPDTAKSLFSVSYGCNYDFNIKKQKIPSTLLTPRGKVAIRPTTTTTTTAFVFLVRVYSYFAWFLLDSDPVNMLVDGIVCSDVSGNHVMVALNSGICVTLNYGVLKATDGSIEFCCLVATGW